MFDQLLQSVSSRSRYFIIISLGLALLGGAAFVIAVLLLFSQPSSSDIEILSESTNESEQIVHIVFIDVNGAVKKPGIYQLPADSRVTDAITKAEGFTDQADAEYVARQLNLSQKLSDGQKIYIPFQDSGNSPMLSSSAEQISSHQLININTATIAELESLEGIGKARAEQIMAQRPYTTLQELVEKKVIPLSVFEKIEKSMTVF